MSNITRTSLDALSQANFPNNTTQQISPADLRDWIESAVDSFVTQKDTSTFENAFYECKSSNITAVSGTTNLALATGNFVHITGSGPITITSFGTLPAGSRFILNFEIAVTIQYNATQMILPGAANIVTAAGDSAMVVSEGAGNWRLIGYFPAAGLPVGTVTAVTASAPLSSTGGNAPDISISQAGATTDGYLSSADWNAFDGKQDALTLTTSGTSGAATLIGSTLNIPNYATGGGSGTVTSVDLTMPPAFAVSGNPITTSGTLAVTGAGLVSQYVRGDGTLANFPGSTGGGSSISYYLNGSVNQGTFGGNTYYEMNKTPVIGTGTNFTINTNGYIAQFITDANDPNQISIPAGNWNFEMYFSASSGGGTPNFYIELYKYNGATFSLIASSATNPEGITSGTVVDLYTTAIAIPQTTLALTDRLAVRIYVNNSGRTITLHTEDNNLCQVITTFTTGLTALNGLSEQVQNFATGTTGTDFAIVSSGSTHTFNIPDASATARGLITTGSQTLAGIKTLGNGINPGEIRLLEGSGSGTNYVGLKSPATLAADYSLTLPNTNPASGQILVSDGSGNLSWTSNPSAGSFGFINTFGGSFTGSAVETLLQALLIPANTFTTSRGVRIQAVFTRTNPGANAISSARIYINTSAVIGGTNITTVAYAQAASALGTTSLIRSIFIQVPSGSPVTNFTLPNSAASATNEGGAYTLGTAPINWAVDQYIILAVAQAQSAQTVTCNSLSVSPQ